MYFARSNLLTIRRIATLGRAGHGRGRDIPHDDLHRQRIAEEIARIVCHAPGAFDHPVDPAWYHQFHRDLTLGPGLDRLRQHHRAAAHRIPAHVLESESASPGAAADVLHLPGLGEDLAGF